MSLSNFLRRLGTRTTDRVVGLASGTMPVSTLDKSGRAWALVLSIGMVAIGGSAWLVWHTISSATTIPRVANKQAATAAHNISAQLDKLKKQDTDHDGLSDYDELYVYHSSPYLYSSAGDGISDGDKVKRGLDPNCPVNQSCPTFHLVTSVTDANGNLTPDFLRQALRAAGVPQTTLDKTDDASLLEIYNNVVKSTVATNTNSATTNINGATTNTPTNIPSIANTNQSSSALAQLQNLTPTAIRQLLTQNGVDATELSQIDDTTLQQIFQQAISSSQ